MSNKPTCNSLLPHFASIFIGHLDEQIKKQQTDSKCNRICARLEYKDIIGTKCIGLIDDRMNDIIGEHFNQNGLRNVTVKSMDTVIATRLGSHHCLVLTADK